MEFQNENGTWGTICSVGFHQNEADVACRQLGFNEESCRDGNDIDNDDECADSGLVSRRPTQKRGSGETVYKKFELWNVYWMT